MTGFLVTSLVASLVLTVLLNVVPRLFPSASRRAEQKLHDYVISTDEARTQRRSGDDSTGRVKVYAPWKAMLIGSLVLTVVVNIVINLL